MLARKAKTSKRSRARSVLAAIVVCASAVYITRHLSTVLGFESTRFLGQDRIAASDRPCLPFIFYDKPVKTGSSSMRKAILKYIATLGEQEVVCKPAFNCTDMSEQICLGHHPPGHLVNHLHVNTSRTTCLHEKGYYHVTTIRNPSTRIVSSFKFNQQQKAKKSNGAGKNVTFEEFLERFPRCGMFHYYDGLTRRCEYDEKALKARAEDIANRMHEIVELDEEPISDLHRRIQPFLTRENVVSLKGASEFHVPEEVSKAEFLLYNTLKKKRISLARHPKRNLCEKQR